VEQADQAAGRALEDLGGYRVIERAPVCGAYRGYRICGMGPPSSGATGVLQILGILERTPFDRAAPGSAEAVHLFSEAARLAYADRARYVGDPDFKPVPVAAMLAPRIARNTPRWAAYVGSASGVPGQLTTFGVGLETSGEIAGVQNDLTLGNTAPIVFSACEVNPDINKDQTIFGFQPLGCMPDINCSGVRALVLSFSNLDPIPDGSTMYSCDVLILPAAAPGEYPIECSNEGVADPDGMALPVDCSDGAITVLAEGPPVAPASLILQKARLGARSGSGGSVLLSGAVNTNPPFGSLDADIAASGLSIKLTGAGGVDFTLSWDAAECTSRQTRRGPKIRCDVDDASGKQRIVLRPMRIPNLLRMKVKGTRLSLFGPFTADPVTATLVTSSFQRPDTIDNCALRRSGALTSCKESGVVP